MKEIFASSSTKENATAKTRAFLDHLRQALPYFVAIVVLSTVLALVPIKKAESLDRPGTNTVVLDLKDSSGKLKGSISAFLLGSGWTASKQDFKDWIEVSAQAIASYYGAYPVQQTKIVIHPAEGDCVEYGETTFNDEEGQGEIDVYVGRQATREDLMSSWTLTHEMVHLTFPIVRRSDRWLAEGIATYVEPIARMRKGLISKEEIWEDLVNGLPKGVNGGRIPAMRGTREWGQVYWGGAAYCLIADIKIRKATDNRLGLEDALAAISQKGGTAASFWNASEALSVGDQFIGQDILVPLYDHFQDRTVQVSLDEIWQALGVVDDDGTIRFDDGAPLAETRDSITSGARVMRYSRSPNRS